MTESTPSAIPYLLSLITFLPLVGAIVLMLMKRPADLPDTHGHGGPGTHGDDDLHGEPDNTAPVPADPARKAINFVAIGIAFINFLLSVVLFATFNSGYTNAVTRNMQFMEDLSWIRMGGIDIHYRMGIDGISLLLILLTTFLMVLCVVFSTSTKQRLKEFMVFLLFLETGMIGVFCALDLVLFYFFWEAMLIPMYFLIGIFGHENRIYAALKFFLYTFAGSVLMLLGIVSIYQLTGSFNVLELSNHTVTSAAGMRLFNANPQALMFMYAAFALAFMVKVPMFPFHTWLPDAHVEAPTAGSVILAGVMLKMGTYGFIRFCLPLFPSEAEKSAPLFIALAIAGIIYGSIVAAVQTDAKKLVAYSSVAHLGFAVLGIFTFTRIGMMGALMQNIAHGIATPMLFFVVGMLYERRHTRAISEFGGLKKIVPFMAAMLLIATLASVAVPFFSGFVGEFPVLLGSWTSQLSGYGPTALAATGMILSAVYMLWWFQRLMLGPVTKPANRHLPDLTRNEWAVLIPLAGMVFWVGLGSDYWTSRMNTSVDTLISPTMERMDDQLPVTRFVARDATEAKFRPKHVPERPPVAAPVMPSNGPGPGASNTNSAPPAGTNTPPADGTTPTGPNSTSPGANGGTTPLQNGEGTASGPGGQPGAASTPAQPSPNGTGAPGLGNGTPASDTPQTPNANPAAPDSPASGAAPNGAPPNPPANPTSPGVTPATPGNSSAPDAGRSAAPAPPNKRAGRLDKKALRHAKRGATEVHA